MHGVSPPRRMDREAWCYNEYNCDFQDGDSNTNLGRKVSKVNRWMIDFQGVDSYPGNKKVMILFVFQVSWVLQSGRWWFDSLAWPGQAVLLGCWLPYGPSWLLPFLISWEGDCIKKVIKPLPTRSSMLWIRYSQISWPSSYYHFRLCISFPWRAALFIVGCLVFTCKTSLAP